MDRRDSEVAQLRSRLCHIAKTTAIQSALRRVDRAAQTARSNHQRALDIGVTINAGFFAPAGLDIGAETSEEIALLIVAEIQRVFEKSSGESLREREMSIHPQQNRDPTLEQARAQT